MKSELEGSKNKWFWNGILVKKEPYKINGSGMVLERGFWNSPNNFQTITKSTFNRRVNSYSNFNTVDDLKHDFFVMVDIFYRGAARHHYTIFWRLN